MSTVTLAFMVATLRGWLCSSSVTTDRDGFIADLVLANVTDGSAMGVPSSQCTARSAVRSTLATVIVWTLFGH
jgi:hypothetical protein